MEMVVSGLVLGSLFFAVTPPPDLAPGTTSVNALSVLAQLYTIVPWLLGILGLVAICRIGCQLFLKSHLDRIRVFANFAFFLGYLFFAALSAAYYGAYQVNWLNVLAIGLISGGLYIERKVGSDG